MPRARPTVAGFPRPVGRPTAAGFPTTVGRRVADAGRAQAVTRFLPMRSCPPTFDVPHADLRTQPIVPPSSLIARRTAGIPGRVK